MLYRKRRATVPAVQGVGSRQGPRAAGGLVATQKGRGPALFDRDPTLHPTQP